MAGGDESVAPIVPRAAENRDVRGRPAGANRVGHGAPRVFHQVHAGDAARDRGLVGAAHLGDGEQRQGRGRIGAGHDARAMAALSAARLARAPSRNRRLSKSASTRS